MPHRHCQALSQQTLSRISDSDSESSSSTSTSYICSTPICGKVFDTAAALRKHERKHTVTRSKDGRIHCDFQHCEHHYGTK